MIKPEELRIGNYVCINNGYSTVGDLLELTQKNFEILIVNNSYDRIYPIELTEEWLLKLGFNKDYKTGYIGIDVSNNDFVLTFPSILGKFQKSFAYEFKSGGWAKFKELEDVHSLQNLFFALTGSELTIKEGK
ncbi:hypothetical protein CEY12_06135 [Chryseobacterium sp. T16E-39]|uniref:hypothetical protein n=1 Tax=Chryseobacterium sp. T16E-39 TaxID=2015076 RepID=UPI000B5B134D|nr:hypothetical protein [Chryseobacterium sp. T16E-39]ASK29707.1 hypothetical protein CEY12_06135 [Chryseobacterium sp. T16E-39]